MAESQSQSRRQERTFSSEGESESEENKSAEVLVGIPAYNEEVGIGSVVISAQQVADSVLVVDDGSDDATAEIAEEAGASVVSHESNRGKGAAIKTLIEEAQRRHVDALVLLDGDGQHMPEDVPAVVKPVLRGESELVIGSRYLDSDSETPLYRRFGQRVLDILTAGSSQTAVTDSQSGFRALSPRAIDELTIRTDSIGVESEMIARASNSGLDIEEVPVDVRYDGVEGQTYNPFYHGLTVSLILVSFIRDRNPLAFFGVTGLLMVLAGAALSTNAAYLYQTAGTFSQWQFILGSVLSITGLMTMFSGVVIHQIVTTLSDHYG